MVWLHKDFTNCCYKFAKIKKYIFSKPKNKWSLQYVAQIRVVGNNLCDINPIPWLLFICFQNSQSKRNRLVKKNLVSKKKIVLCLGHFCIQQKRNYVALEFLWEFIYHEFSTINKIYGYCNFCTIHSGFLKIF